MTVFEPDRATWKDADGMLVEADAIAGEIRARWAMGTRPASRLLDLTLTADQADRLEGMLLNARLWLAKAQRQRADLEAAAQLADDDPCMCGHPAHADVCGRVVCTCDCPGTVRYYPIPTETTEGTNR